MNSLEKILPLNLINELKVKNEKYLYFLKYETRKKQKKKFENLLKYKYENCLINSYFKNNFSIQWKIIIMRFHKRTENITYICIINSG